MEDKSSTKYVSKFLIVIFLYLAFAPKGFSQEVEIKKELDSISRKMFEDMNNRDFDAIMDMTHPELFKLVPKESMIDLMKSMFEGTEELSILVSDEIPDYYVSSVFRDEENNSDYAFVDYDLSMTMTFHKQEFDEEAQETMVKMMKLQDMDVDFLSNNSMAVNMLNRMTIIIKDESTNNKWAMINYDPNSPLFFQILSASVLEKAKDYYQDLMIEHKKKQ